MAAVSTSDRSVANQDWQHCQRKSNMANQCWINFDDGTIQDIMQNNESLVILHFFQISDTAFSNIANDNFNIVNAMLPGFA